MTEDTRTVDTSTELSAVIDNYDHSEAPATAEAKTQETISATDQQIDDFLKEVEQIKLSSPVKPKKVIVSEECTPNTSMSTQNDGANSSIDSISKDEVYDIPDIKLQEQPKESIPKSVSQALFSTGALKVTKIREKSVAPKFIGLKQPPSAKSTQKIEALQSQEYGLNRKIKKLQSEIDYLNNLIENAGISSDLNEVRKLRYAIEKLQSFLDQKEKEKYEIGIQLTRAVRKRIDSGESGEFWVN